MDSSTPSFSFGQTSDDEAHFSIETPPLQSADDDEERSSTPHSDFQSITPSEYTVRGREICTTNTLSSLLLNEQFSDQQIVFKDSMFPVIKGILAANSKFFANLWYLEFKDKDENPLDLSNLSVDVDCLTSILRGFYDLPFTVTKENAYDLFYLSHYFRADRISELICSILEEEFQSWEWVVNFIVGADKLEDKRALEYVCPHLKEFKTDCDYELPLLSPSSLSVLLPFCSTSVSHRFFVQCMVMSYVENQLDKEQLHDLLNSMIIELLSVLEWNLLLINTLGKFSELKFILMEFHFDHLRMASLEADDKDSRIESLEKKFSILDDCLDNLSFSSQPLTKVQLQYREHLLKHPRNININMCLVILLLSTVRSTNGGLRLWIKDLINSKFSTHHFIIQFNLDLQLELTI
ncbi:hypothetical protein GEMRC1_000103 [Eukaryota sp. GEM-RC1]